MVSSKTNSHDASKCYRIYKYLFKVPKIKAFAQLLMQEIV